MEKLSQLTRIRTSEEQKRVKNAYNNVFKDVRDSLQLKRSLCDQLNEIKKDPMKNIELLSGDFLIKLDDEFDMPEVKENIGTLFAINYDLEPGDRMSFTYLDSPKIHEHKQQLYQENNCNIDDLETTINNEIKTLKKINTLKKYVGIDAINKVLLAQFINDFYQKDCESYNVFKDDILFPQPIHAKRYYNLAIDMTQENKDKIEQTITDFQEKVCSQLYIEEKHFPQFTRSYDLNKRLGATELNRPYLSEDFKRLI